MAQQHLTGKQLPKGVVKVTLWNKETGDQQDFKPVDARQHVKGGAWTDVNPKTKQSTGVSDILSAPHPGGSVNDEAAAPVDPTKPIHEIEQELNETSDEDVKDGVQSNSKTKTKAKSKKKKAAKSN